MQDPSTFLPINPQISDQENVKCPRCDSINTKFCYYNNYNLSQPRHFCKNCRRYWTRGGALRKIPIGGGSRKNTKRSSSNPKISSSSTSSSSFSTIQNEFSTPKISSSSTIYAPVIDQDRQMLDIRGSFSSLLSSNEQFGNLLDGLDSNVPDVETMKFAEFADNSNSSSLGGTPVVELQSRNNPETFLGIHGGDSGCWSGENGWPDLSIYTPADFKWNYGR